MEGTAARRRRTVRASAPAAAADEEITDSSGESGAEDEAPEISESESEAEADETAADRRRRLARQYLDNLAGGMDTAAGFDAHDVDKTLLAARLREDVAETKGRAYRQLADGYDYGHGRRALRRTRSPATGIAAAPGCLYTVAKDGRVTKWVDGAKVAEARAHKRGALCVAASTDGKLVATGGGDRQVCVFDGDLRPLGTLSQHRDAVTAVVFRRGTHTLYSASADRTVKVWSAEQLAYVETLFGHQDSIAAIAALAQERCLTVGARDRSARMWKIADESQLVFRAGPARGGFAEGSVDAVVMIDHHMFVTGGDSGALALWTLAKKRPVHVQHAAHGLDAPGAPARFSAEEAAPPAPAPQPRWITALAAVPYSDLFVSGSWGGVRVWRVVAGERPTFEEVAAVPVPGVVNGIAVVETETGLRLAISLGAELRGARWLTRAGRNGLYTVDVPAAADTPAASAPAS
ncbi:WD40-repeat-containing domain protein [Dipodascopsis tothii]|uniref:WD40-repeat-containing domain protein n=1 Tax=Dipodascopsis tothii TaxID=44089 RepID=UPI0034CE4D24